MGILINNMKIIHTSTFTIIHTNFNNYLETTQRKQREIWTYYTFMHFNIVIHYEHNSS